MVDSCRPGHVCACIEETITFPHGWVPECADTVGVDWFCQCRYGGNEKRHQHSEDGIEQTEDGRKAMEKAL